MNEILTGVLHWTRKHPKIGIEVSSYYLVEPRVLIDPLLPEDGLGALPSRPEHCVLTNRHHYRDCGPISAETGCTVWCVKQGMHEFKQGERVKSFQFGDELPGGITAIEIGVICPDETALHVPLHGGIVAVADGVVRRGPGPLQFVPDAYMGDDPDAIKSGLKTAYLGLARDFSFDHLLLAHGDPWVKGAKAALEDFARS